jgi:hypothetical protein
MNDNYPSCPHTPGCRSRKDGACRVLKDTDFKGKPCPFYKTALQNAVESKEATERLIAIERTDLIEKYYSNN